jgi:hypothetical protein
MRLDLSDSSLEKDDHFPVKLSKSGPDKSKRTLGGAGGARAGDVGQGLEQSEEAAKLAQMLGQLQPFTAVFSQEGMGQLAYFGPT